MSVYRVIVSFNAYRKGDVASGTELWDADKFVRAGYLKLIEEVSEVDGTVVSPGGTGGDDVPQPRRRGRKAKATEVTDEPDRAVSDAGPADREEQGA